MKLRSRGAGESCGCYQFTILKSYGVITNPVETSAIFLPKIPGQSNSVSQPTNEGCQKVFSVSR